MLTLKRIAIFLVELSLEAILLGSVLGALVSHQLGLLNGMLGSIIAVPVILGLHGYYIWRILAVTARASKIGWLYPVAATSVFIAHVLYIVLRFKSDLSPVAQAMSLPFLIGGACVVLACSLAGSLALRKWAPASNFATAPSES
jgi:hypothetical protein